MALGSLAAACLYPGERLRCAGVFAAGCVLGALAAPDAAGVLPLFFPRITIYYLQITGKYKPLAAPQEPVDVSVEDDPAPAPAQADGTRDEGGET